MGTPAPGMRFLPYGERSLLVELPSLEEVHRLHQAVTAAGLASDCVPGWRTLLVTSEGAVHDLRGQIEDLDLGALTARPPTHHEIPIRYDGEDLDAIAGATGLGVEDVIALHLGGDYQLAFLGFSGGFPYLVGLPPELHLPRRGDPRPRVPAGSVAIGSRYCGIYPHSSPGGWHLVGRTSFAVFDTSRRPPNLLAPGDVVRFVADR